MIQKDDEQIDKARAKDKEEVKGAADSIVKKKNKGKKSKGHRSGKQAQVKNGKQCRRKKNNTLKLERSAIFQ